MGFQSRSVGKTVNERFALTGDTSTAHSVTPMACTRAPLADSVRPACHRAPRVPHGPSETFRRASVTEGHPPGPRGSAPKGRGNRATGHARTRTRETTETRHTSRRPTPERSAYASIRLADRSRAKLRASSRDTCIWETPSSALICDCVRLL